MKFEPIKLGVLFVFIGTLCFYIKYTDTDIKSPSDLCFTKGHLFSYHFVNGFRGTYDYTFKLKEYSNPFQIKADFANIFQAEEFKKLKEGEELTFAIYKNEVGCLNNTANNIRIYSLESSKTVFLATNAVFEIHNSHHIYFILAAIFFVGLVLIVYGYLERRKKRWTIRIRNKRMLWRG